MTGGTPLHGRGEAPVTGRGDARDGASVPPGGDTRTPHLLAYGDDAVLVEVPDLRAVHAVAAGLAAARPDGVVDVVPAARTVLVRGAAHARTVWATHVEQVARAALAGDAPPSAPRTVEVPVVYDGDDLDEVARLTGLGAEEVVARHLAGGPEGYRVAFGGFMPGFAYVVGLDPALHVPRLASPRTAVPAGSVAVAGEYTAVYPGPTPGGWRLLGRSDVAMFDLARPDGALLAPGDVVRFVRAPRPTVSARAAGGAGAVPEGTDLRVPRDAHALAGTGRTGAPPRERVPRSPVSSDPSSTRPADPSSTHPPDRSSARWSADPATGHLWPRALTVVAPGALTLVEDLGRPGRAAVGVPRSGAADPAALVRANRLVGNRRDAAALEVVLGGLVVRFGATTAVALVGAAVHAELDGVPVPLDAPVRVAAGAALTVDPPVSGLRTWLAVRGGLVAPPVLGSASRDVLSGLGPAPLQAGDVLPYGTAFDGLPEVPLVVERPPADLVRTVAPGAAPPGPVPSAATAPVDLPAVPGPRHDHLDDDARARLWSQPWRVTPDSNRVAVRLDGPPLGRAVTGELASEGLVLGAVQVPPDGRPVVFGPDHPVTGGYPVVAVLTAAGVARAAQLRPGDAVRLVRATGSGGHHPPDGT